MSRTIPIIPNPAPQYACPGSIAITPACLEQIHTLGVGLIQTFKSPPNGGSAMAAFLRESAVIFPMHMHKELSHG